MTKVDGFGPLLVFEYGSIGNELICVDSAGLRWFAVVKVRRFSDDRKLQEAKSDKMVRSNNSTNPSEIFRFLSSVRLGNGWLTAEGRQTRKEELSLWSSSKQ